MQTVSTTPLTVVANTIRGLALDAIDACNSGHPGLPLGCAEIFAVLYGRFLNHNPLNPKWAGRDRFILSAGHGSMGLYASLHIAGFEVKLDDLKAFRTLHSITPGHPECRETPGVETTTGPLGQGVATAVGMALAAKHLGARLHSPSAHQVVALAGDGCMMEGICSEASSLAGHLKLDNLILIYDSNDICLDGATTECFTEDVGARYRAYGWNVTLIDGHNIDQIEQALESARSQTEKPSLIIAKTTIGKGSPTYQGSSEAHGKAFGKEESSATKSALGLPSDALFFVPDEVKTFFSNRIKIQNNRPPESPNHLQNTMSEETLNTIRITEVKPGLATRAISQALLQVIHDHCPSVIGGSADLSCSDSTLMKTGGILSADNYGARNIKYGVREFAMAAASSGLALEGLRPFCGTFLVFSDYMKNAVRLAALMRLPVIYQFTHDSFLLGEDGPTHQPVEHLAALRAMPTLTVFRPADTNETKAAWIAALSADSPTALVLTRQGINDTLTTSIDGALKGGYIVIRESDGPLDYSLIATGSELSLAVGCAAALTAKGHNCRVISLPSFEVFDAQSKEYQNEVLGNAAQTVSIEAQSSFGWHKYIGREGIAISIDRFGLSAPAKDLAHHFGFTVPAILNRLGVS